MDAVIEKLVKLDSEIVALAKDIQILSSLSWDSSIQVTFLKQWHQGKGKLPVVSYRPLSMQDKIEPLKRIEQSLAEIEHPISCFLLRTVRSYLLACHLLNNIGTDQVCEYSKRIYGKPGDLLPDKQTNNLEAAQHFIEATETFKNKYSEREADYCLPAEFMQTELSTVIDKFFHKHAISVEIDPNLVSKAAAGRQRIRLRAKTCFSEYDLGQLLQHEAFVHSLTAINGMEQVYFKTLSLSAPRATATQEGLATFAELITGNIDIFRMQRIALRIVAIDMALNGADFIEVFRYFLQAGQSENESFNSSMRVFRGVKVTGGAAFTKDTVYLHGLLSVHTFFRWALQNNNLKLCKYLFAGRMTLADIIELKPFFEQGLLSDPHYVPPWFARSSGLFGNLAFSLFANRINLNNLQQQFGFAHEA